MPEDQQLAEVSAARDEVLLGAVDAIEAMQQPAGSIVVVGFGESAEVLAGLESGPITAAVARLPKQTGAVAVDLMVRHLNGDAEPAPLIPGVLLITKDKIHRMRSRIDRQRRNLQRSEWPSRADKPPGRRQNGGNLEGLAGL